MTECIDCGIHKFQWDGRISLVSFMKKHNFKPSDEVEVYLRGVNYE